MNVSPDCHYLIVQLSLGDHLQHTYLKTMDSYTCLAAFHVCCQVNLRIKKSLKLVLIIYFTDKGGNFLVQKAVAVIRIKPLLTP